MAWKVDLRTPPPLRRKIQVKRLRQAALSALTLYAGERSGQLTIALVDDQQTRDLNRRFLGKDSPTDVLAFGAGEPEPSETREAPYLGDVVISHQRANEQGEELGHGLQRELEILVTHGVLHLLGYDDRTPSSRDQMWEAQSRALALMECK